MKKKGSNILKRKPFLFGGIAVLVGVVVTVILALVLGGKSNTEEQRKTLTAYDDAYYDSLLAEGNRIDERYLIFEFNDDDENDKFFTFKGFNETLIDSESAINSTATINYFRTHYLYVPSTLSKTENSITKSYPVRNVVMNYYEGLDLLNGIASNTQTMISYIKAIVLEDNVTSIAERSFYGFGDLEYLQTPFIGTNRTSSANSILNGGESKPLVKMFSGSKTEERPYAARIADEQIPCIFSYWYETEPPFVVTPNQTPSGPAADRATYWMPHNLQKIVITDDSKLGNHALFNITSLTSLEIREPQDASLSFGYYTFAECTALKSIIIPENNTILNGSEGLFSKTAIEDIKLPGHITSIPDSTFAECTHLKEVWLANSVTEIGKDAFFRCEALDKIQLFDNVWSKPVSTNYDFSLPQQLNSIGATAFSGCINIKEVEVPKTTKSIGMSAFANCNKIVKMVLPFVGAHREGHLADCNSSATGYDCHSLFGYIFAFSGTSNANFYAASQTFNPNVDGASQTFAIPTSLKEIIITDETDISYGAFQNLQGVTNLTLNNEVKSFKEGVGNGMVNLTDLTLSVLPGQLGTFFGKASFTGSYAQGSYRIPGKLKNVVVNNQKVLQPGIFNGCTSLEYVEIGKATTRIEGAIFFNNEKLTKLVVPFVGINRGEWGSVYDSEGYWTWSVTKHRRNTLAWLFSNTYHTNTYPISNLSAGENYIKYIPNTLREVEITDETGYGTYSLREFSSLTKVTLRINENTLLNNQEFISEYAMTGCVNLEELDIPFIGANQNKNGESGRSHVLGWIFGAAYFNDAYAVNQYGTFYIPKKLTSVTIGNNSSKIFNYAFNGCESIKTISTNANITQLGAYAFADCKNLSSLNIRKQEETNVLGSYTHVADYAFYNCKKLYKLEDFIPETVKTIGNYAFAGTSIGYNVNPDFKKYSSYGSYCFANCLYLDDIIVPLTTYDSQVITLGEGMFSGCQVLKKVVLENKNIKKNMFKDCINLVGVDLLGVTSIPEGLFNGCTSLEFYDANDYRGIIDHSYTPWEHGVRLDDDVNQIGAYAFKNCSSMDKFTIYPSLRTIKTGAFQGCTGLENMTMPTDLVTIEPNGWIGCNPNFYFWVYEPQENWSTGWVDNWNCDYPVYVLNPNYEEVFTYHYNIDEKKYYITGVVEGNTLSGIVTIPSYHNGIKVVGIDSTYSLADEVGATRIKDHEGITKIILPNTVTKIIGQLTHAGRVDIYTELTKSEVDQHLANSYIANPTAYTYYATLYNSNSATAAQDYATGPNGSNYDSDGHETDRNIKGWVRGTMNNDEVTLVSKEVAGWYGGTGYLYYKDDWQFGTGVNARIPYLKTSSIKMILSEEGSLVYSGDEIRPYIDHFILPGEVRALTEDFGGEMFYDPTPVCFSTEIFNVSYLNNVAVGRATVRSTINTNELRGYNESLDSNFPLLFVGENNTNFTIMPCPIAIYYNSTNFPEGENLEYDSYTTTQVKEYDGSPWRNNEWSDLTVVGLDAFNGVEFSGTLATVSSTAGIYVANSLLEHNYDIAADVKAEKNYYRGGFKWEVPYKFTRNGVDLTKNFKVDLHLVVKIERKDVEIQMADGIGFNESNVYQYRYMGDFIAPKAVAVDHATGKVISECVVVSKYFQEEDKIMYPNDPTAQVYSYLKDATNYRLVDENGDGNDALEWYISHKTDYNVTRPSTGEINNNITVTLGTSESIVGVVNTITVVKGLIIIRPQIRYTIPVNENYWSNTVWTGSIISGIGKNSVFNAKMITAGILPNTAGDEATIYNWQGDNGYKLQWVPNDLSLYNEDTHLDFDDTIRNYHIYNSVYHVDGKNLNEIELYDVQVSEDSYVRILYNDFSVDYFVAEEDNVSATKTKVPNTSIEDNYDEENNRHRLKITYKIDGKYYVLDADAIQSQIDLLAGYVENGYSKIYYHMDGEGTTTQESTAINFRNKGIYRVALQIMGRHFNTYYANIELHAEKSDVIFGNFDKEYDREEIDFYSRILKKGLDYSRDQNEPNNVQVFEYAFYKNNSLLNYNPVDVGTYEVRVKANETDFFNAVDKRIEFDITPRKLYFDISTNKVYDGERLSYEPTEAVLNQVLPGETLPRLLDGDIFAGTLYTNSNKPNEYNYKNSNVSWLPAWSVSRANGADATSNYEVVLSGSMIIEPKTFVYTAEGEDVSYDGNPHFIHVNVTYPANPSEYKIYYSIRPINKNTDLSLLNTYDSVEFDPGEFRHYFAIVADNFETVYDYRDVIIRELIITYDDPAKDSVSGASDGDLFLTLEYDGSSQEYRIQNITPWNYTIHYREEVNGTWGPWTEAYPTYSKVGVYHVQYKIEAPFYETVESGTITISVIEPGDPVPENCISVEPWEGLFDNNPHKVDASFVSTPAGSSWMRIYYSVDGDNWQIDPIEFIDAGKYRVFVRFEAQGYASVVKESQVWIKNLAINIEFENYVGDYDGEIHNVGIRLNAAGIAAGDTLTLDPETKEYIYNGVTLNYYFTTVFAVADSNSTGWTPRLDTDANGNTIVNGFKDYRLNGYNVYVKLTAANHEDLILKDESNTPTTRKVIINYIANPTYDTKFNKFEYNKNPIKPTISSTNENASIYTIHDGNVNFYYYAAYTDENGIPHRDMDNLERIPVAQELGVYYVVAEFSSSTNCAAMTVELFMEIVPKVLDVEYTDVVYYTGEEIVPDFKIESGTDDQLRLLWEQLNGTSAIECGAYQYRLSIYPVNNNYTLRNDIAEITIIKREITFTLNDTMEAKKNENNQYVRWTEEDSASYLINETNHWQLLDLGLLNNHIFYIDMQTNRGNVGTYFYQHHEGDPTTVRINRVEVLEWDIYLTENNQLVLDENDQPISCRDLYVVNFDITVEIQYPKIDLEGIVEDRTVTYNGAEWTINLNLPSSLNTAHVFYKTDTGNWYATPPTYTLVGEYEITFNISCTGYSDTQGVAKLIIEKADLDIDIESLDPNGTGADIYDAQEHINKYKVTNVIGGDNPSPTGNVPLAEGENGHRVYYSAEEYTLEDIQEFYENFNPNSAMFRNALTKLEDAGDYYCVVYYAENIDKWNTSYAIKSVTYKQKDLHISIPGFSATKEYDGTPIRVPLTNAVFDTNDLIYGHVIDQSAQMMLSYYAQTKSANVDYYSGPTGFDFGSIYIYASTNPSKNLMKNYHPVFGDDVEATIIKTDIRPEDFVIIDPQPYVREYDGTVVEPLYCVPLNYDKKTPGTISYFYYLVDENDNTISLANPYELQYNVGKYYVGVMLNGDRNYNPWTGSEQWGYVTVTPKTISVEWDIPENFTFDGTEQNVGASITNVYDEKIDLSVEYRRGFEQYSSLIFAGSYEATATFDPAMENYDDYVLNYILDNQFSSVYMNKMQLTIQLGDGVVNGVNTNKITSNNGSSTWMAPLYATDTPGQAEILDFPSNLTLKGPNGYGTPYIGTLDSTPGLHTGRDAFDFGYFSIFLGEDDATDSIEYDVLGSVTIYSNEIIYELFDKEFTYEEGKTYSNVESLNCIIIHNPSPKTCTFTDFSLKITKELPNGDIQTSTIPTTTNFPSFGDVGTYELTFRITSSATYGDNNDKYADKIVTVTINIVSKKSFIAFTSDLNKVYDGASVTPTALTFTNDTGFNGTRNDLKYAAYEIVMDETTGQITEIPFDEGEYPSEVGKYKIYITSTVDDLNEPHNYDRLESSIYFEITPRKLTLAVNWDVLCQNDGQILGQIYHSGNKYVTPSPTGGIGLVNGTISDVLVYEVTSDFAMVRNLYTAKALFNYTGYVNSVYSGNDFNAKIGNTNYGFNLAWNVYKHDSTNMVTDPSDPNYYQSTTDGERINATKNYYIDFDFRMHVHYPLIDATVTGGKYDYEPLSSSFTGRVGTLDLTNVTDALVRSNLLTYYGMTQEEANQGRFTDINDPALRFSTPGTHTVYYKIFTDYEHDSNVPLTEPLLGNYTIEINYAKRENYTISGLDKTYDGLPAGSTDPVGDGSIITSSYLPTITLNPNSTYSDYIDWANVTIQYQKVGSSTLVNPEVGCIDAGDYFYRLVIPRSVYYDQTIVEGTFKIAQALIKVSSRDLVYSEVFNGRVKTFALNSTDSGAISTSQFFNIVDPTGLSLFDPSCPIILDGTLVTRSSVVKEGGYTGLDNSLQFLYSSYVVYDRLHSNADVSRNYAVDLSEAKIMITPATLLFEDITRTPVPYDGLGHTISIRMIAPANSQNTVISYYDEEKAVWTNSPIYKTTTGEYTIKIKITSPNYQTEQEVIEIPLVIEKAATEIRIVDNLNQTYNGYEVSLPGSFDTNNIEADRSSYTFIYQKWVDGDWQEVWNSVTPTGRRPVHAGRYRIIVQVPETANFESKEISEEFEISPLVTRISWVGGNYTYNGQRQVPRAYLQQLNNTDRIPVELAISVVRSTNSNLDSILVGGYSAYAEIDSSRYEVGDYVIDENTQYYNYNIHAKKVTIRINQFMGYSGAYPVFEYLPNGATAVPGTYYYSADIVSTHTMDGSLRSRNNVKGVYNTIDDFEWQNATNSPIIRDASGINVTSNYEIKYDLMLNINESDITYGAPYVEKTYDGNDYGIEVVINGASNNPLDPEILNRLEITYSTTGQPGTFTSRNPKFRDVGLYPVYYQIIDPVYVSSGGLEGYQGTYNITPIPSSYVRITPADANVRLKNPDIILDKDYDALPLQKPEVIFDGGSGDLTVKYYKEIDGVWHEQTGDIINAGNYKLVAQVDNTNGNYNPGEELNVYFEVRKKVIIPHLSRQIKEYNGLQWSYALTENDFTITNNKLVSGHVFRGTVLTKFADRGTYTNLATDFEWQNSYRILDASGADVTSNYDLQFSIEVEIIKARMKATGIPVYREMDGNSYCVDVHIEGRLESYLNPDTNTYEYRLVEPYEMPQNPTIWYSLDGENYYTKVDPNCPVRDTVGPINTTVYWKVTAPNYEDSMGTVLFYIWDPDDPNGGGGGGGDLPEGDLIPVDPNLRYDTHYIYTGEPFDDPTYDTTSTGTQTVVYYDADDTEKQNPLPGAPTDAGEYIFVITIAADEDHEEKVIEQRFKVYPREVELTWDNLTFVYDGNEHLPSASYTTYPEPRTVVSSTDPNSLITIRDAKTNAGVHTAIATTSDTNYVFTNASKSFEITALQVPKLILANDGQTIKYREPIKIIEADTGNEYQMDNDGNIIKIIAPDGTETDNPELPYRIIYDSLGDVGNGHEIRVQLKDTVNNVWVPDAGEDANSADLVYTFNIERLTERNDYYNFVAHFQDNRVSYLYNGSSVEPPVIVKLYENTNSQPIATLVEGRDFTVTYDNNNNLTENAKAFITGIGNYDFSKELTFIITEELPEILSIISGSKIQFITAEYDPTEGVTIVEDGTIAHTKPKDEEEIPNMYLGGLHQNTTIQAVLNMFENDQNLIEVFDQDGILIPNEEYETKFFGTGFTIKLYRETKEDNENREAIDYISAILFGDMNSDGLVSAADISYVSQIASGEISYDTMQAEAYFAGIVDRSLVFVQAAAISYISRVLSGETDFNEDYSLEENTELEE